MKLRRVLLTTDGAFTSLLNSILLLGKSACAPLATRQAAVLLYVILSMQLDGALKACVCNIVYTTTGTGRIKGHTCRAHRLGTLHSLI